MRPARIKRHVPANGANLLTARVGGEVQPVRSGGLTDGQIDHTGFDDREARLRIEPEDSIHLVHGNDQSVLDRDRAATQAGAAAPGHEGNRPHRTHTNRRHHFLSRHRYDDGPRRGRKSRQSIALIRRQGRPIQQTAVGRKNGLKIGNKRHKKLRDAGQRSHRDRPPA